MNFAGTTTAYLLLIALFSPLTRRDRRSKIKCVHAGSAPCRKCERSGIAGCSLSRPGATSRALPANRAQLPRHSTSPRQPSEQQADPTNVTPDPLVANVTTAYESHHCDKMQRVSEYLTNLSSGIIVRIMNAFTCKFPELGMLHPSSFLKEFQISFSTEGKALLAAILAAIGSHLSVNGLSSSHQLLPEKQYASFARVIIADNCFKPRSYRSHRLSS